MSTPLRTLWLAWGAVVALLAYPAGAQTIGQQNGIMGGDSGFLRTSGPTVTIAAMPYTRTVTCGSYTLTGSASGAGAVSWSASPSGASGSCTGTTSWSCVVSVAPDATGEGVETITVLQSGGGSDTETIGFPVTAGLSSCFDAHNVDGSYNATLANADPVATWTNAGPAAKNITQGVALSQPSFRTSVVAGNPVVRCDGGDSMVAAAVADWIYLHSGAGAAIDAVVSMTNTGLNTIVGTSSGGGTSRGILWRTNTTAVANFFMNDGTATRLNLVSANNVFTANTVNGHLAMFSSADTPDATAYINGSSVATGDAAAVSTLDPAAPLTLCARGTGGASFMTGDIVVIRTYTTSLTSTQRGINQAVDQWRLGGSFPVTP